MIAFYVTSIETFSGKTAMCLGLAKRFQADKYKVGYFKPLGTLPHDVGDGRYCDEDAMFAAQALNLNEPLNTLSPVCLTPQLFESQLAGPALDLMTTIIKAYTEIKADKDVVILEGGASLREGYAVGLPTPTVARMLGAMVLCVVKYHNPITLIDDALTADGRLGDQLLGIVINGVPADGLRFAREVGLPYLEKRRIPVFGILPEENSLQATSVGEIATACQGTFLCGADKAEEMVENLVVGAMGADQAKARLQDIPSKAVITGGDRTDIIIAALETSAKVIILTGNLQPGPIIIKQATEMGIPIVQSNYHTMRVVGLIERFFGKSRVAQPEKLARFEAMLAEHFDFARFYDKLGLERK